MAARGGFLVSPLHAIQQAIEPALPLQDVLNHWNQLAADLRERSRHRVPQVKLS